MFNKITKRKAIKRYKHEMLRHKLRVKTFDKFNSYIFSLSN